MNAFRAVIRFFESPASTLGIFLLWLSGIAISAVAGDLNAALACFGAANGWGLLWLEERKNRRLVA